MECFRKNLIATLKKFQAKLMTLYQNLGEEEPFQVAYRSGESLLSIF